MICFRKAEPGDVELYFRWANDESVRRNSYNQEAIRYEDHVNWFNKNISDESNLFLLFFRETDKVPVGQVRFMKASSGNAVIGVSLDESFRGQGFGTELIRQASDFFHERNPDSTITAYIKEDNTASIKSFTAAGFVTQEKCNYKNSPSVRATKYDQNS